jgi:hypothetical protein
MSLPVLEVSQRSGRFGSLLARRAWPAQPGGGVLNQFAKEMASALKKPLKFAQKRTGKWGK